MMWHLLQMFHTLVGERKSLKQPRLPQGLAFVPPRKHSSLASPLKNKDGETSALSCRLSRNSSSGTADLNKRLLYKSHNSSWLHAPVQADVCVCGWENITHFREKKIFFYQFKPFFYSFYSYRIVAGINRGFAQIRCRCGLDAAQRLIF